MKFFYPLVKSTIDDCEEFKYSLRSLQTHFKDDIDVYVCGYIPKWLDTSKVTILQTPTSSRFRMQDSTFKLLTMSMVSEEFVWIHDDMYLLGEQDDKSIKQIYYLEDFNYVKKFGDKPFQQRLKEIHKHFSSFGTSYNYATHTPMYFKSNELITTIDVFNYLTSPKLYIETMHYNYHNKHHISLPVRDVKVGRYNSDMITIDDFNNKLFCNFDEAGISSGIFNIIKSMFTTKSSFEL